jgi:hypothetical protein
MNGSPSFQKWRNEHSLCQKVGLFVGTLFIGLITGSLFFYDSQAKVAVKPEVQDLRAVGLRSWPPFVRIVPQAGNDNAMVYAEGIGHVYSKLGADFGSTSHTWSHTDLEYDEFEGEYRGMAVGALGQPCQDPTGCLHVYAYTAGGTRGSEVTIPYEFASVGPALAPDLALYTARLRFVMPPFTDGVTHTVTLLMPPVEPAPLPGGWRILEGGLYVVESDGVDGQLRASLAIGYDPDLLDYYDIQPMTLRLWRWDASQRVWVMLNSQVNTNLRRVSASIDALTAYALAAPPRARLWLPLTIQGRQNDTGLGGR